MGKIIAWLLGGKAAPLKKSSYGEASHLRQPEHAPMFNKIRNGGGNQPRKKKNNHEIISPVPSPNRGISSRRRLEAMNIEAVRFPAMNSNRKS